jgi:uncharacterized membrane protein YsdA (DUF1294 family)
MSNIYFEAYLIMINFAAVLVTVSDKRRARKHRWRIPENTLLLVAALGGSPAMLATMLLIRHKTRHPKFMIGIPLILILQAAALYFIMNRNF